MKSNNKGFTIIEVLTVLVIGAVIMALGFLAITAAQRSGRNTQRTADISVLASAYNDHVANIGTPDTVANLTANKICTGTSCTEFNLSTYAFGNISVAAAVAQGTAIAASSTPAQVKIQLGAQCDTTGGGAKSVVSANPKSVAIMYARENATGGSIYACRGF